MGIKWSPEQEAVLSGKGNMLVSASAGSGKTTVVVERVLRLLTGVYFECPRMKGTKGCGPTGPVGACACADVRRILLMTFTRAAARDMREKLLEKMYAHVGIAGYEKLRDQIAYMPFAHIETIDSFCSFLMRKYFNDVEDCDPSVSFGDEMRMKRILDECFDRVVESKANSPDNADFLVVRDYFRKKRSYEAFREAVYALRDVACNQPDRKAFYDLCEKDVKAESEAYLFDVRKEELPYLVERLTKFIELCEKERYLDDLDIYKIYLAKLKAAQKETTLSGLLTVLQDMSYRPANREKKNKSATVRAEMDRINKELKRYDDAINADRAAYKLPPNANELTIKRVLVETARDTDKAYAAHKAKYKLADISDAMDMTLAILSKPERRKEVSESFDFVFVDEYQDTDRRQEALVDALDRGNLFLVGDVKQSIYQFRSAEPTIFLRRRAKYDDATKEGTTYPLNTNYRSVKPILDFANRICSRVMTERFGGVNYAKDACLQWGGLMQSAPARAGRPAEPPVQAYFSEKPSDDTTPVGGLYSVMDAQPDVDDNEAEFVAQKIKEMVTVEGVRIDRAVVAEDGSVARTTREIGYGDVAVLTRTKSSFRPLAAALTRNGIPFYTPDPIRPSRTEKPVFPERDTLVDVLRVCVDGLDDVALFNALTSPVFGFTQADLVEIVNETNGKTKFNSLWDTLFAYKGERNEEIRKKIEAFRAFTDKTRLECAYKKADELLNGILDEKFDAHLLGNDMDALARLNAFISYVSGLPANASAEAFLAYYDEEYLGNKPPVRKDAVSLMTMHGSKGLEFPVVFLPYSDYTPGGNRGGRIRTDGELGLSVDVYNEEEQTKEQSFCKYVFRQKQTAKERRELARLMYVAFTRARDYLVVSGTFNKTAKLRYEDCANVAGWIQMVKDADPDVEKLIRPVPACTPTRPAPQTSGAEPLPFEEWENATYDYPEDRTRPVKESVSAVLARDRERDGETRDVVRFSEKGNGKGSSAAAGTAVHRVMQYIPYGLSDGEAVKNALDDMRSRGILTEEERAFVSDEKILRALQSEVIGIALRCESKGKERCKREQPFLLYREKPEAGEGELLQGVIDLLIEDDDGWIVVDFKTGKHGKEELIETYGKQLALYAEATEKILNVKVKRKVIYAVDTGETVDL